MSSHPEGSYACLSKEDSVLKKLGKVKGDGFARYREEWRKASNFEIEPGFPIHIDFETSYICNLACVMCTFSGTKEEIAKFGNPKEKLNFKIIKRVLDEGKIHGLKSIGLNGNNEPLLDKELVFRTLEYSKKTGIVDSLLNTNGMLLNKDISKQLILSGLTRLQVSLDAATEKTYNKIRINGDFQKVLKNIDQFLELRKELKSQTPFLRVSFCEMTINQDEKEHFLQFWEDKADLIAIQDFGNPFTADDSINDKFNEKRKLKTEKTLSSQRETLRCSQPNIRAMIRSDGNILPCCTYAGYSFVLGNIHDTTMKDTWESKEWRELVKSQKEGRYYDNPYCKVCFDERFN